jgi:hypothetical protein
MPNGLYYGGGLPAYQLLGGLNNHLGCSVFYYYLPLIKRNESILRKSKSLLERVLGCKA